MIIPRNLDLSGEPPLAEILSDPIVQILMRQDGWSAQAVQTLVEAATRPSQGPRALGDVAETQAPARGAARGSDFGA